MHQKFDPDFKALGKQLTESNVETTAPLRGVGKRCYIRVLAGKEPPMALEMYAETVVTPTPGDPAMGFTHEDLTLFRGVAIYVIHDQKSMDGKHASSTGRAMPFEDFLKEIPLEKDRIMFVGCMARLEEEAGVKQGFIDRLNSIWQEREASHAELYTKRVH